MNTFDVTKSPNFKWFYVDMFSRAQPVERYHDRGKGQYPGIPDDWCDSGHHRSWS